MLHSVAGATLKSLLRRIAAILDGPMADVAGPDVPGPGSLSRDVPPGMR